MTSLAALIQFHMILAGAFVVALRISVWVFSTCHTWSDSLTKGIEGHLVRPNTLIDEAL